ncbi:MAG: peroxiredoxin [Sphingomonas sp.]|uniref:peroxiredoxin n=1 Tax=Sphingomonas sp. TaxID=28214 RepID=UPI0025D30228|nr:peroxiredoxin [Sphingomonas sp.]MBX9881784.1 peroxiredoxin [Sphingomonas sp.]
MALTEGEMIPDLTLVDSGGNTIKLRDFVGRKLVLYFYPKDDTSGCTKEAQDFSQHRAAFDAAGVRLLGVSKDSPDKHRKFIDKYALTVPLASDEPGTVLEAFGAWVEKSMYGKKYMGIERSTFLFGADGRLARAWPKVKVPGHAAAVLEAATALG